MNIAQQKRGKIAAAGASFAVSWSARTAGSCTVVLVTTKAPATITPPSGVLPLQKVPNDNAATGHMVYAFYQEFTDTATAKTWTFNVSGYAGPITWHAFEVTGVFNDPVQGFILNGGFSAASSEREPSPGTVTAAMTAFDQSTWTANNTGSPGWGVLTYALADVGASPYDTTWSSSTAGDSLSMVTSGNGLSLGVWRRMSDTDARPAFSTITATAGPAGSMSVGWLALATNDATFTGPAASVQYAGGTSTPTTHPPPAPDNPIGGAGGGGGSLGGTGTAADVLRLEVADATGTMVDRLATATEVNVKRPVLDVGTLTATFKGTALDPATSTALKAGRAVTLSAHQLADGNGYTDDQWTPLFTGKVRTVDVESGNVTMVAVDPANVLASTRERDGVATVAELGHVLGPVGVTYDVGTEDTTPTVVWENGKASALDQLAITRDTTRGYAWVTRAGVVKARAAGGLSTALAGTWDESDYSAITVGHDTDWCINDVTVKWLRYLPSSGASEPIEYGPYQDAASITAWGVRSATFTIGGAVEDATAIGNYAAAVLAANATPAVRIQTLRLPVKRTVDLAPAKALVDLYDLVHVSNTERALSHDARVVGVEHTIRPDSWLIDVTLADPGRVALPQVTPDPEGAPVPRVLDDLEDVNTAAATDGQVLTRSGAVWVAAAPTGGTGGGASTLDDLTDVDTTTTPPADNAALVYDATAAQWKPQAPSPWLQIGTAGAPAFQNGWTTGRTDGLCFIRLDPAGNVHVKGTLKGGTNGTAAFILPVGMRPSTNALGVVCFAGPDTDSLATLDILTTGEVKVFQTSTTSTIVYIGEKVLSAV